MLQKKYVSLVILATIFISSMMFGQEQVLRLLPASESTLSVMEQIMADTAANGGVIPAGRVYELDGGAVYLNTAYMYVEETFSLHMRSNNDQKAIIYQYPTGVGDNPQNPPGYFVRSRGGDIRMENIALTGYYEPNDDPSAGTFDQLYTVQGNIIRTDGEGASIYLKGCVFSNINGQVIRTNKSTNTVKIEDCVFGNLGALSTSNFGAGKGIDLRESSCDSLILVNNTFVNYQDRVVRHYNYGDPAAGTGNIEHGIIDHNTFVNGMGFHGLLSLGNVGAEMTITNNLFVDAFAAGEDSTDATRTAEWANTGEQYANGNNRIAWTFAAPTGGTAWKINNNLYSVTSAGQGFFDAHTEITVGEPLSNYIKGELGSAAGSAFTMVDDPVLADVPDLMLGLMEYYVTTAGKLKDTPNDVWDPATQDMDRKVISYYVNDLDVSYSTSSPAYTGAENNFPVGNLNAYPDKKAKWLNGEAGVDEQVLRLLPASESTLSVMEQIMADTAANGGVIPAGRVYELDGGAVYLNTAYMYVEETFSLHMRSNNDQKAIIYQYPTGVGDNPQNPPGYFVRSRGGDIRMENIALTGYYEPNDDPSAGTFDQLYTVQGNIIRTDGEGASIYLKGCVFSNINGQVIRTNKSTNTVKIEDCVFGNLGALSTSNFGAGKGIDLRESSCDSLILVNNTFVNYQDRVVRHYNYGDPAAGTGNIEHGIIDHNTFVNGMGFHGLLSLGNVGAEMTITNNLFVDAFAAGEDSTDATRTAEWANTGEQYANGNNRIAWTFAAPTGGTAWKINNNLYSVTSAGQGFFDAHTEITVGEPLSNYIKGELGSAAGSAFTMVDDPVLADVPDLMLGLMEYYVTTAGKLKDTPNDVWDPATQDMDRKVISYYVNDLDVSYPAESVAYTGAENGFPTGNLNAFPEQKSAWLNGQDPVGVEKVGSLPSEFSLSQNYPNPFNPTTMIKYSLQSQSNVTLKVYDILGSEVATLINNEVQSVGQYEVDFDASRLSSGIYFYSINAGDFVQTKKMILLK